MKLNMIEANAPKPKKPERGDPRGWVWQNYYDDLACWKATQAERYLSGIQE